MTGYERPTEKGKSKETVTFWAELWRPSAPDSGPSGKGNVHGEAVISPKFATQRDLIAWISSRKREGDEVSQYKRVSRGADYDDDHLTVSEELTERDHARVVDLVAQLKNMLDTKKKKLDKDPLSAKPYARVSEFNPIERPLTYEELYEQEPA